MVLAVGDSFIYQLGILFLLRRSEDEGRVGGGILRFVFPNGCEVTGITDDSSASGLELIQ